MSSQGWAKAPEKRPANLEAKEDATLWQVPAPSNSSWRVWTQVIIGEILNVLERRRYDNAPARHSSD